MTTPHSVLDALNRLAADPSLQPDLTIALQSIAADLKSILPQTEAERTVGLTDAVVADLKNRFTYHAPKPGQPEIYAALRLTGLLLAQRIAANVPPGREQSLALTKVEEAIFWANAAVARHGK